MFDKDAMLARQVLLVRERKYQVHNCIPSEVMIETLFSSCIGLAGLQNIYVSHRFRWRPTRVSFEQKEKEV